MKTSGAILLLALLTVGSGLPVNAYNDTTLDFGSAQTLRGIQQVIIRVEGIDNRYGPYGLALGDLRDSVSDRLEQGHLRVSDGTLPGSTAETALLDIQIRITESAYYYYSYSISLNVVQRIPLARENTAVSATTWSSGINGVATPTEMGKLKTQILSLVSQFLSAHQQQN